MKKITTFFFVALLFLFPIKDIFAEENTNETELNFFTGMFDFSDDNQASGILGLQHQNEDLYRQSFLGK